MYLTTSDPVLRAALLERTGLDPATIRLTEPKPKASTDDKNTSKR
ncbi:hypothetical protein [Streptosporangium sp. NPDC002721]